MHIILNPFIHIIFITSSYIHLSCTEIPNIGNILSTYICAMYRKPPTPLTILVHLSSNPRKENITYFTYIYFTRIVLDISEYENNLSRRLLVQYYL